MTLTLSNILDLDETELRRRCAEAAGWKWEGSFNSRKSSNRLVSPDFAVCTVWKDGTLGGDLPPDYLNSYDAILPLVRTLNTIQLEDFAGALRELSGQPTFADALLRATPLQHAAAFLFAVQGGMIYENRQRTR